MAGIINTNLNKNENADARYNNFVGYDAEKFALDPKSTVQQQVADITKADGVLMQQARTGAVQTMNKRGLINSSMAIGAGEEAVIKQALPIASQDASTNFDMQKTNNASQNRATEVTVDATNKAADVLARLAAEKNLSLQNFQQDLEKQKADAASQVGLQEMRGRQQQALDAIAAQNQRVVGAGQNAALIMSQAQVGISEILKNADWTPEVKQVMLDKLNENLNRQLQTIGAFADVDVSSLLTFTGSGTAAQTTAQPAKKATPQEIAAAGASFKAGSANNNEVTVKMAEWGQQKGLTLAEIASGLGKTPEQISAFLASAGVTYTEPQQKYMQTWAGY